MGKFLRWSQAYHQAQEFARSGGSILRKGQWQCPEVNCLLGLPVTLALNKKYLKNLVLVARWKLLRWGTGPLLIPPTNARAFCLAWADVGGLMLTHSPSRNGLCVWKIKGTFHLPIIPHWAVERPDVSVNVLITTSLGYGEALICWFSWCKILPARLISLNTAGRIATLHPLYGIFTTQFQQADMTLRR